MSLRDYFLLDYAELLAENTRHDVFWRIISEYLYAAGPEGRRRLKEHILHVALHVDLSKPSARPGQKHADVDTEMDGVVTAETKKDDDDEGGIEPRFQRFADIRETCDELELGDEWRIISRVVADRLVRNGELGVAAAMCLQAEEGDILSRITELILDAYITKGESSLLSLDSLDPVAQVQTSIWSWSIHCHRLFLARRRPL